MAENKGMSFRLTISPFTVTGTVGCPDVRLRYTPIEDGAILGREDFFNTINKLERLRDEVCRLNNYEGEWDFKFEAPAEEKA